MSVVLAYILSFLFTCWIVRAGLNSFKIQFRIMPLNLQTLVIVKQKKNKLQLKSIDMIWELMQLDFYKLRNKVFYRIIHNSSFLYQQKRTKFNTVWHRNSVLTTELRDIKSLWDQLLFYTFHLCSPCFSIMFVSREKSNRYCVLESRNWFHTGLNFNRVQFSRGTKNICWGHPRETVIFLLLIKIRITDN